MGTSFSKKRDSKILSRRTIAWGGKYGVSPNSSIETPPVVKALFGEDGVGLKERIEDKAKYVKFTIRGTVYRVHERYTLHELIGTGAYGKVVSAVDSLTGKNVAIKRIPALFNDRNDAIRVLREIKVARELGDHANIVRMVNFFLEPGKNPNVAYLVFERMSCDLRSVIDDEVELSIHRIRNIIYKILRAVKYLHSANVLHRDVKPGNILLNREDEEIKLCDFGLARGFADISKKSHRRSLTHYVVTRYYRAPEVITASGYGQGVDIWALGCVFAEMLGQKVMFRGEDEKSQVIAYLRALGKQDKKDLDFVKKGPAKTFLSSYNSTLDSKSSLPRIFEHVPKDARDLLERMLRFNPSRRIKVSEALEHPFFHPIRIVRTEINADNKFDLKFEKAFLGEGSKKNLAKILAEFRAEEDLWVRLSLTGAPSTARAEDSDGDEQDAEENSIVFDITPPKQDPTRRWGCGECFCSKGKNHMCFSSPEIKGATRKW
ncbi:hypothetical protein AAMO2058_000702900 [Amorphochlora amoebiformis]|uniref:Protein kinase domain-containing protein n=1 Tax=Amorphochlora amoebiformis TaxID=1561963 RepID=A0A7S0CX00_9EUKA|mmetsp:Transcript_14862/g.23509  ORF Transcript_14862/g.23509 Transcript_14862/m.23509 type:complete len:490 (+) Transcript_14862:164-1633(+)